MKDALALFAQDATSKLILYTAADIRGDESDDQVLAFLISNDFDAPLAP
jgi:hypothetical protein